MPRKARMYESAPYYHIMVQGINKEHIFEDERSKIIYLKLLKKYIEENNISLIAYCIMGNHSHVLCKVSQLNDLSKCMKQINLVFAQYYNKEKNRIGYVFRDRFRAEPIYEFYYLHNCIKYIHMNPVKAKMCKRQIDYNYSSYKGYLSDFGFLKSDLYKEIFHSNEEYLKVIDEENAVCYFIDEEFTFEEAKKWLDEYLKDKKLSYNDIYEYPENLYKIVKALKNECKIKNREISKLLNVNEHKIGRILKNEEVVEKF